MGIRKKLKLRKSGDSELHLPVKAEVGLPKPHPPIEVASELPVKKKELPKEYDKTKGPFIADEGPVPFVFLKSVNVFDPTVKGDRKAYKVGVLQHLSVEDAVTYHGKGYGFIMGEPRDYFENKEIHDIVEKKKEMDQVLTPGAGRAQRYGDLSGV